MRRWQQKARLGVVAAASFVLLVLVLPQIATGIGLGGLAHLVNAGPCGSSGSSGSMGSGSGSGGGSSQCGPPTLTVDPATGLVDGQSVSVTGSGFTPFSGVAMVECEAGATGPAQCDLSSELEVGTDGSGSFATTYTVSRVLEISTNENGKEKVFNCGANRCILGAADVNNYSIAASTPLGFKPHSPLAFRATVAATSTVTTKTGVAEIAGTVTCTQLDTVDIYVELQQRYKRFNFTNDGEATVECKGHTPWTVPVPPGFGLFGVGAANVQAELSTQIGNNADRNINITRNIELQSAKKK
jgi:hypothetical protein